MRYGVFAILIAGAYLVGSVPFALLIAGAYGKDLRLVGSGNIGATNLSRALGRKWGYICFLLDALKGAVPVLIAMLLVWKWSAPSKAQEPVLLSLWLAIGCAAVLGHVFPLYLCFKGGKGVATSFGVAVSLWPYFTVCAMAASVVWVVVLLIWRYVSLASVAAAVAFPVTLALAIVLIPTWRFDNLWPLIIAAVAIPVLVAVRHRQNISRLIAGTENKIAWPRP